MKQFLFIASIITWMGCVSPAPVGLYEKPSDDALAPHIGDFYSLSIYDDAITNDHWHTASASCITVKAATDAHQGAGSMLVTWNKPQGGCNWIGMGFGWENWTAKNISSSLNQAALSFWVKNVEGKTAILPWAIGFEDFAGSQCWTGVTASCVVNGPIEQQWTQVIVPLPNFPFETSDIDPTNIKQVIIQLEASGSMYFDQFEFIPFDAPKPKSLNLSSTSSPILDGVATANEWPAPFFKTNDGDLTLTYDAKNIYLSFSKMNKRLWNNKQQGADIWNGDAIELAFSTDANINSKRKFFYDSDQHLGISLGNTPVIYNWISQKDITANCTIKQAANTIEVAIPWTVLNCAPWSADRTYGLEAAIDVAGDGNTRSKQLRWNSEGQEGFNSNPSLWGTLSTLSIQP